MRLSLDDWAASAMPAELATWLDDYTRSLRRRGRSAKTIALYRRTYVEFWRWALDAGVAPDPAAVTTGTINSWVDALREQVAPTTVAIRWRNLRPFFSWWAREVDAPNPFTRADVPGVPRTLVPVIPLDDIRKLLAACAGRTFEDRRDTAVILVLVDTGVRLGELVGLTVDDWERRSDLLFVSGKTGPRAVPLSAGTGEALARYTRERAKHPQAALPNLWLGRKGAWGESGPAQMLARRCAQAGISRLHPHQFRHTWAHLAKAAGLSEGDLQHLAGWRSPIMVQRYGSSAAAERAQSAYRRLAIGDQL